MVSMDFLIPYSDITMFGTLFFVVIIILSYMILNNSKTAKAKRAPKVQGAWPIIGHLSILAPPKLPDHIELATLADKYGSIFTMQIGIYYVLVVNNVELAKEIFTTNDTNVTFRPSLIAGKLLGYDYALFPFTPGGPYWREMRKVSVLELLSNRRLEMLKYIMVQEVEASIKELWRANGKIVEMKQWLSNINLNVLLRMIIGKKFSVGEENEKEKRTFEEGVRDSFFYFGGIGLRDVIPFLGWMDLGGHEKRMKKIAKEIDDILGKWLEEHKKKNNLLGKDKQDKDFMDFMISSLDGKDAGGYDADTINKATCLGLLAGYETATVALTWAVTLLLNNKHVIKKAQEELDRHVGKERIVKDEDISKLVYLQAIVKETLRLHPPSFIPVPRIFKQDCTIGGYDIPKGTWLMVNLWKIQRDPNIWSDPMEFKPERFLTSHKKIDVRGQHFELLPFGGGRRACPATSYGVHILHLTLATLLHAFEISTPNNEVVDMSARIGLTSTKLTDLQIIASPRIPSYCFD